jgi:outer membrane receptor protein involved in Fe transport
MVMGFAKDWHLTGGVRYEKSQISLNTYDPYRPTLEPLVTTLDNIDPLPAASVVYSVRQNMNFRGSYSRTVNRPEFREMAPFQFTDISGRSTIIGNPNLKQSKIDNVDFRWEWFSMLRICMLPASS